MFQEMKSGGSSGIYCWENPEDRWSRFPIRFQRSEMPKLPPGCQRLSNVGDFVNEQQAPHKVDFYRSFE
jgi:hypothetical protein